LQTKIKFVTYNSSIIHIQLQLTPTTLTPTSTLGLVGVDFQTLFWRVCNHTPISFWLQQVALKV